MPLNGSLAAGHRRIAMINNVDDIPARHGREQGFRARCAEAGLPAADVAVERSVTVAQGGYEAAIRLLRGTAADRSVLLQRPDGHGRLSRRRPARPDNPDDLSVVGFDDLELIADGLYPGLTTIALPHYEMGVWAVDSCSPRSTLRAPQSPPGTTSSGAP